MGVEGLGNAKPGPKSVGGKTPQVLRRDGTTNTPGRKPAPKASTKGGRKKK